MRKNIFLILLLTALFVFVGAMNKSARATSDVVEFIENAKTPVYLHSLAGGDSLVHNEATQVDNWWHSLYPIQTYCHNWHVIDQYENGIPGLNPSDWIRLQHVPTTPGDSIWVHVEEVTITLMLTLEPTHSDTMYVEYTGGYDSLLYPITNPVSTWWHEIWPEWSRIYQLTSWIDIVTPGQLSYCDTIDLTEWWHVQFFHIAPPPGCSLKIDQSNFEKDLRWVSGGANCAGAMTAPLLTGWVEIRPNTGMPWLLTSWIDNGNDTLNVDDTVDFKSWWHVEDVAIDIQVLSGPVPRTPTMTQWGVIVLAALIVASAVYIMLRRRRATVPA